MKQNFKKKAFTLVELLVVIAIVAVLASVSIVGYMHFIDKAHTSNDVTLVKQLNTMLSASYVNEGNNKTMRDAVEDITEGGITVDQLKSESNEILWDQDSDRFLVSNGTKIVYKDNETSDSITSTPYKLWKVYDEIPETQNYSIYLNKKEEVVSLFAEPKVDFTLTTGFDAGYVNKAFNLTYNPVVREENTIINMNAGKLILNSREAHVNFVGTASDVELSEGILNIKETAKISGSLLVKSKHFEENITSINIDEKFNYKDINILGSLNYLNETVKDDIENLFTDLKPVFAIDLDADYKLMFTKSGIANDFYGNYQKDYYKFVLDTNSTQNLFYKIEISINVESIHSHDKFTLNTKKPISIDIKSNEEVISSKITKAVYAHAQLGKESLTEGYILVDSKYNNDIPFTLDFTNSGMQVFFVSGDVFTMYSGFNFACPEVKLFAYKNKNDETPIAQVLYK